MIRPLHDTAILRSFGLFLKLFGHAVHALAGYVDLNISIIPVGNSTKPITRHPDSVSTLLLFAQANHERKRVSIALRRWLVNNSAVHLAECVDILVGVLSLL